MAAGALSGSSILLAAALAAALLVASASAQSGCTTALVGLYPCMNYISGSDTAPTKSCCSQLGSVVQSQPQCLCSALGGDSSSLGGVTINKTRALELPMACNVQTPPASRCNGGGSAPSGATPDVQTPAGSGSKATPSAYLQENGGSSLRGTVGLVFVLAVAAVYAVAAVW
ncbi:Non-specific lipid-transfer protein-like protein [Hordeum vulgare]|uniref:Bifunctional inhibitor/plant lipid transfer protein/seed storage helical domain-containing protein n=1 Tax=Hordeum vulgare subsp. vulgare TaxID=112509 RepID=A0A8I6YVX1_HORVV|nr:non-specific lipid transfer protein GPI-anchored 5-like [Hordeum vulgare subsp. vulgare]KAE8797688.1 Non-specific lipid-transfer protein-like protein [Hordeum vulgare]